MDRLAFPGAQFDAFDSGGAGRVNVDVALLERNAQPNALQIREALSENMCRCGTYPRIEKAVLRASGVSE